MELGVNVSRFDRFTFGLTSWRGRALKGVYESTTSQLFEKKLRTLGLPLFQRVNWVDQDSESTQDSDSYEDFSDSSTE